MYIHSMQDINHLLTIITENHWQNLAILMTTMAEGAVVRVQRFHILTMTHKTRPDVDLKCLCSLICEIWHELN